MLTFANCVSKAFYGILPVDEMRAALSKSGFNRLNPSAALSDLVPSGTRHVVVSLCGVGTTSGFVVEHASMEVVSPDWWLLPAESRLYVFAYSCHSARHLSGSHFHGRHNGAVGYEGEIWLDLDQAGLKLWSWFVKQASDVFKGHGTVSPAGYEACVNLYSSMIRSSLWWRLRGRPSAKQWHLRIFASQQRSQLRFLHGGKV